VLSPSIRIQRAASRVEFAATSVIETGFLEEYVCTVGTREHESLFAFDGKASEIHAAMLLAGFVAGAPGQWREVASDDGTFRVEGVAPRGDGVDVEVRLEDGRVVPIAYFVRASPVGEAPSAGGPPSRFVFGGSRFRADRRTGVERYLADGSGSLIGLVTFGDETIGPSEIVPDQASAAAPLWEAFTERMPKPGTKVTVLLSRRRAAPPPPHRPPRNWLRPHPTAWGAWRGGWRGRRGGGSPARGPRGPRAAAETARWRSRGCACARGTRRVGDVQRGATCRVR
jgi:hypothetical protein